MNRITPGIERRKHHRYKADGNIFAALGQRFSRVGKVKDISPAGIAFEYISEQKPDNDRSRVDIFVTDTENGIHLSEIACRTVYETLSAGGRAIRFLPENLRPRRCGIKFMNLTEEERSLINELIDRHTSTVHA